MSNTTETRRESNESAIPERLKSLLREHNREFASRHDSQVSEKSEGDRWSLTWSRSEWSGYHDENNYYTSTTTVTDQEPTLKDGELLCVPDPSNRDYWQKRLPGYQITEYFETFTRGADMFSHTNRFYIKLGELSRALWIIRESEHSR